MEPRWEKESDYRIIWCGKPVFKPYFLDNLSEIGRSLRFLLLCISLTYLTSVLGNHGYAWNSVFYFFLLVASVKFFQLFFRLLSYRNTRYWITKKTICIDKGMGSKRLKEIERVDIRFIDITVSKIERKYNDGTVVIDTGETRMNDGRVEKVLYYLEAIEDPLTVVRIL